jgi:hypothetical protein
MTIKGLTNKELQARLIETQERVVSAETALALERSTLDAVFRQLKLIVEPKVRGTDSPSPTQVSKVRTAAWDEINRLFTERASR